MKLGRLALVVGGLAAALSCAEGFSPGDRVSLAIVPVFTESMPGILSGDLDQLHIRIARVPSNALVIDTTVAVDTSGNVDLPLTVPLLSDPEQFSILLEGVRSSDAAVLYSGADTVQISAGSVTPPPVQITVNYVGPCGATSGCQVTVGPQQQGLAQGDSLLMTVVVDSGGIPVVGVPVSLLNLDTSLVRVRTSRFIVARTGTAGGTARVIAAIRSDSDTLVLNITSPANPQIGVNPNTITFNATAGGSNPASQGVNVTNTGSGTLGGLGFAIQYNTGTPGWLSGSLSGPTAPATLTLSATTGALAPGTYTATVTVQSTQITGTQTVNVSFIVGLGAPASLVVTPGYAAIRTTAPSQTVQLSDTIKDSFGNVLPNTTTWTSRSPAVATVSASGLVSGVAAGSAVIVAQAGSAADSMVVTVGNAASAPGDMLIAAVTNGRAFGVRKVGQSVAIDIRVDQLAVADSLGSYNARFSWNTTVLTFDSVSVGNYPAPTVNDSSAIGVLRFAAVDANSRSGTLTLARLWFTAVGTGSDGHVLQVSDVSGVSPNFFNYFTSGRYVVVSGSARITP
ncbi:MAG TPA: Ig-like domain-containing protein [Gemmatimonadales bacterium]|nr:Ig-like domain-containing protein [Gemmatimonadales bacterium]